MKKSELQFGDSIAIPEDMDMAALQNTLNSYKAELEQNKNELRLAQEKAAEAEQKYSVLYDFSPSGYITLSADHRIIEVNPSGCQILGMQFPVLRGTEFDKYVSEKTLPVLKTFYRNIAASRNKEFCEVIVDTENNQSKYVFIEGMVLGNRNELLLNLVDITGLEKSAMLLQQTRQNYETFINSIDEFLFVTDTEGKIIYSNLTMRNRLGYSATELSEITFELLHPPAERMEALQVFNSVLKGPENSCNIPLCTKSGELILAETGISHGKWNGKPAIFVLSKDVTEQKRVEHILQISEKKYRTMLNASPDGMLLIDLDGRITEISEIGLQLFGSESRDEIIGREIMDFVPFEEHKVIIEMRDKTINEGLTQNMEVVIRKNNEIMFPGEVSATLIQGPDGAALSFMIIVRDISQRKKAEAKQLHADRMANLGEMASGIAHEINQPLNIISMVLEKILFDTSRNQKIDIAFVKEKSERIFENITRIRNIIDHIRAFSRNHDDYVFSSFNINTAIESAVSMTNEQFKHLGIDVFLNLDRELPVIFGNIYKFEQVVVNLLVNSKDAVLEKKGLGHDFTDMAIGIRSFMEDQKLIVEVTDNGIGIKDDDLDNVILPFYTTKDEGKGTGLGLSICYQIIKELNGTIDIISTRSSGTKIRITLEIKPHK